jgi:hypothetical protein
MMVPSAPVMGIGVVSFTGRWRSSRLLVLEYVAPESESQGIAARRSGRELGLGEVAVIAVAVRE